MAHEEKNLGHAQQETVPELEALKEWWKSHSDKITYALIAVLALIIGAQQFDRWRDRSSSGAFADYWNARTGGTAALEQVVADGKSPSMTALTRLLLGQQYFTDGKYDIAREVYEALLKDQPNNPFAGIAKVGVAFCAEGLGDTAGAAELFKAFADANPGHFLEPMARIGYGRNLILSGEKDRGKTVLDLFITENAGNDWASIADDVMRNRNRLSVPKPTISSFLNDMNDMTLPEELKPVGEVPVEVPAPVPANPGF